MSNKIYVFDTTLRDGEQSPGVSLNVHEKLEIARQLQKLNVDIIEAGFPISSHGDFEAVSAIAKEIKGPVITALARINKKDIDRAWEAVKAAESSRIHTFIATSEIHMKYKLRMTREQVLEKIKEGVSYAKKYTDDIEFSPEDGSRSELDFICKAVETAIAAGATTINIPDTVGYSTPDEFGKFIKDIRANVSNINKAIISVHCHNDLGLAVANSLSAFQNGARQVECAVNGIGERAGNTALEEIVMNINTRKDFYDFYTDINTEEIYRTSRLVQNLTGMSIQPNKAIVGKNAFAHESGIHQDGVLKERTTYEIMNPDMIGLVQNNLVLGKHSGRHAFKKRLEDLGFNLKDSDLAKAFARFKDLADKKKEVSDKDLEAIVEDEINIIPEKFVLEHLQISSGNRITPTATIGIKIDEELKEEAACGDGSIDAVFKAVEKVTNVKITLQQFYINAVTGGKDAIGEVTVKINYNDDIYTGRGISTDVIEASAKAYVSAINKLYFDRGDEIFIEESAKAN